MSYRRRRARRHALHYQLVAFLLLELGLHLPALPVLVLLLVPVLDEVTDGHHKRSRPGRCRRCIR